jgi:hypothetical protein
MKLGISGQVEMNPPLISERFTSDLSRRFETLTLASRVEKDVNWRSDLKQMDSTISDR